MSLRVLVCLEMLSIYVRFVPVDLGRTLESLGMLGKSDRLYLFSNWLGAALGGILEGFGRFCGVSARLGLSGKC